jgi:hypothetical protein
MRGMLPVLDALAERNSEMKYVLLFAVALLIGGHDNDAQRFHRDGLNEWHGEKHHRGEAFYVPGLGVYACSNPFDAKYYLYCN